jgi:uncharacterized membrane protein HdeD (DUF308 family)
LSDRSPRGSLEDQIDLFDHRGHGRGREPTLTSPDLQHADQPTPPTSADRQRPDSTTADFPSAAIIAYGLATVLLGITLLVWPGATLLVAIAFLSIQVALTGLIQIARCLSPWAAGAGERTLLAVSGAIALLIALLILRRPLQTLVLTTVLVGAWWIVRGVIDVVTAASDSGPYRAWTVVSGLISVIAGIYVMLNPGISLLVFVRVTAVWMILSGVALAIAAFMLRRDGSPELAH